MTTGDDNFRVDNSASGDISGAQRNLFFAAVQTTRMPMLITDPKRPDNPIIFANRAFCEMSGYSPQEILGHNCRFLQGPETDPDMVREIREAIAAQRETSVEIINYKKDGSAFWNALFISPVLNEAGELIYFFASQLDVSRRRDAEDALRQAQKMEALGQLTGGIAHDFNNLLQVMLGYLDLIRLSASRPQYDQARLLTSTAQARAAAEKAATLTQQLLAFSRKQKLEGRVVNLNQIVRSSADMAQRTVPNALRTVSLEPQLWNCRLDPTQLEVAVLNILLNARDALAGRPDPSVTIETRNVDVDDRSAGTFEDLRAGRYVSLAITDNGVGIPAAIKDRVMDPFFTTKDEGQGTGLGLSMVYGFVKQSGGSVRIYSEEGVGTTLRMYFPAADAPAMSNSLSPAREEAFRGNERVLIVEDRPEVADLSLIVLQELGYACSVAHNGAEALRALEAEPFDLLFTDLIMPGGMNGVVLAREARKRHPSLRILLTTGYSEASLERTDAGGAQLEVISKPYLPLDLAKKVRQVLDGPNGVS